MKNNMTVYGDYGLFDAMNDLFRPFYAEGSKNLPTDITETDDEYRLEVEMPGYKKEDISLRIEDGYLTLTATKKTEEKEGKHFVRREISETRSRSYFVGKDVEAHSVKARYENGMLTLTFPKAQPKNASDLIAIE